MKRYLFLAGGLACLALFINSYASFAQQPLRTTMPTNQPAPPVNNGLPTSKVLPRFVGGYLGGSYTGNFPSTTTPGINQPFSPYSYNPFSPFATPGTVVSNVNPASPYGPLFQPMIPWQSQTPFSPSFPFQQYPFNNPYNTFQTGTVPFLPNNANVPFVPFGPNQPFFNGFNQGAFPGFPGAGVGFGGFGGFGGNVAGFSGIGFGAGFR